MDKFIKRIDENCREYGSIPFWSWNDKLDPVELRRQIRNMHELDMRGFFMHARGGLQTEYMGEEWFENVVEKDEVTVPAKGGGTRTVSLDYTFVRTEEEVSYISTEELLSRLP